MQLGFKKVSDGLGKAWADYKVNPEAAAASLNTVEGSFVELQKLLIPVQQQAIELKP